MRHKKQIHTKRRLETRRDLNKSQAKYKANPVMLRTLKAKYRR